MWRVWTKEEDDYLRANWEVPDDMLGAAIGRTDNAVRNRRSLLRLPQAKWEGIKVPEAMSKSEKEHRIIKLANEMRIRLEG
jgi:transcription antitermination factor NusA-like protein